ncbi:MAG: FecR family protein [Mangrovibacterium sp.]
MKPEHKINLTEYLRKLDEGKLNGVEKEALREYIASTYRDQELDELMALHWENLQVSESEADTPYFETLKNKIWLKILSGQAGKTRSIGWKDYLVRIAAVLFIPLLLSSVYLFYRLHQQSDAGSELVMQQVFASPGSRVHFTLPDQSEVWLNSGSTLEYPVNFGKQGKRTVKLTGQGYFNVTPDKNRPFRVETVGDMDVEVLGTSFDVACYDDDPNLSFTLEHGAIALHDKHGKEIARLEPGQQARLEKDSRKLLIEKVDTRLTTSWKDGRLVFKDTPLFLVTQQLERWFNCEIHVAPELLSSDILYTATIQDETLGEVLKMIEISTSVKTEIKNREVNIRN